MDCLGSIDEKIGGPGVIVEIDESLFYKPKNHVGRSLGQGWIFGGVERNNHANAFMVMVPDRTADTLLPIIQQYVHTGTTIISDCWGAYNNISELGYTHQRVNHSENFVDPANPEIYTQNIENFWRWAKKTFLSTTKNISKRLTKLGEHIFRKKYKSNILTKIFMEIKLSYPPR